MFHAVAAMGLVLMCATASPDDTAALGRAKAALRKKDFRKARTELQPLLKSADPKTRIDALNLAADADLSAKSPSDAVAKLISALGVADDSELPPSAFRKVHTRASSTAKKAKLVEMIDLLSSVTTSDRLLAQTEKWPLLPENVDTVELAAALEKLRALKLRRRVLRVEMAVALARVDAALADSVVKSAPDALKLRALRVAARVRGLAWKREHQARLVERVVQLCSEADGLDPALSVNPASYRRSMTTSQLCEVFEPGSCRKAEEKLGLRPTMTDFSTGIAPVLSDEAVEKTHAEYTFLLERCLREAMMRDDMLRGVNFEMAWAVQPTGKPSDIQIEPRRYREHPGTRCMTTMIEAFRYPRYRSQERRVVTMTMNVAR